MPYRFPGTSGVYKKQTGSLGSFAQRLGQYFSQIRAKDRAAVERQMQRQEQMFPTPGRTAAPGQLATRQQDAAGRFWENSDFVQTVNAGRTERGEITLPSRSTVQIGDRLFMAPDGTLTNTDTGTPVYKDARSRAYTTTNTGIPGVYSGGAASVINTLGVISPVAVQPYQPQPEIVNNPEPKSLSVSDPYGSKVPVDLQYAVGKGAFWYGVDVVFNSMRGFLSAQGQQTGAADFAKGVWSGLSGITQVGLSGIRSGLLFSGAKVPVYKPTGDRIPRDRLEDIDEKDIEWVHPSQYNQQQADKSFAMSKMYFSKVKAPWNPNRGEAPIYEEAQKLGWRHTEAYTQAQDTRLPMQARDALLAQEKQAAHDYVLSRADALTETAFAAAEAGDLGTALTSRRAAIDMERAVGGKNGIYDPYMAYTWVTAPEREDQFLDNVAAMEIQLGRPLTNFEIWKARDSFMDPWKEMAGDAIFDWSNLLAGPLEMGGKALFKGPASVMGKLGQAISKANISWLSPTVDYLGKRAVRSQGSKFGHAANEVVLGLAHSVDNLPAGEARFSGFIDLMRQIGNSLKKGIPAEGSMKELLGLPAEFGPRQERILLGISNAFMSAGELMSKLDPEKWGDLVDSAFQTVRSGKFEQAKKQIMKDFEKIQAGEIAKGLDQEAARIAANARVEEMAGKLADDFAYEPRNLVQHIASEFRHGYLSAHAADTRMPGILGHIQRWNERWLGAWTRFVLSARPAWVMRNYADNTFRALLYGTNPLQDLSTLIGRWSGGPYSKLLSEGVLPTELVTSLAREGSDAGAVLQRIIESGKEYRSFGDLWSEALERARAERDAFKVSKGAEPGAKFGLGDWAKTRWDTLTNSVADWNNMIETSFKLRMFDKTFHQNFEMLKGVGEKFIVSKLKANGASDETIKIFQKAWSQAHTDPAKVRDLLTGLQMGTDPLVRAAVFLTPDNLDEMLKVFDPADRMAFTDRISTGLQQAAERARLEGKDFNADEITRYFNEVIDDIDSKTAEMLNHADLRDAPSPASVVDNVKAQADDLTPGPNAAPHKVEKAPEAPAPKAKAPVPGETPLEPPDIAELKAMGATDELAQEGVTRMLKNPEYYKQGERERVAFAQARTYQRSMPSGQARDALTNYLDQYDYVRNKINDWFLHTWPNPLGATDFGKRADRWDKFAQLRADFMGAMADDVDSMVAAIRAAPNGAVPETTLAGFLKRAGFEFEFKSDGSLRRILYFGPGNHKKPNFRRESWAIDSFIHGMYGKNVVNDGNMRKLITEMPFDADLARRGDVLVPKPVRKVGRSNFLDVAVKQLGDEKGQAIIREIDEMGSSWARETGHTIDDWYDRLDIGLGGVENIDGLYQKQMDAWYYLKSRAVLESKMPNKATPAQVRGLLKAQGVSPAEMEWSNLDDFLAELPQDATVSKQDLLNMLDNGGVTIEEKILGEPVQWQKPAFGDALSSGSAELRHVWNDVYDIRVNDEYVGRIGSSIVYDQAGNEVKKFSPDGGIHLFDTKEEAAEYVYNQEWHTLTGRRVVPGDRTSPHYETVKLPGGENYREIVFKWDPHTAGREYEGFKSPHFEDKGQNLLAHARFEDRVDDQGRRVLHVMEIQSDWHQAGRKRGYADFKLPEGYQVRQVEMNGRFNYVVFGPDNVMIPPKNGHGYATESEAALYSAPSIKAHEYRSEYNRVGTEIRGLLEDDDRWVEYEVKIYNLGRERRELYDADSELSKRVVAEAKGNPFIDARYQHGKYLREQIDALVLEQNEYARSIPGVSGRLDRQAELERLQAKAGSEFPQVPAAPFEKNWDQLVMKRMLRYAADNGYDVVAFPTGAVAAKIEGHPIVEGVDTLLYNEATSTLEISSKVSGGKTVPNVTPDNLKDYVGSDIANALLDNRVEGVPGITHQLYPKDVTFGGEKMRWFYDKKLINDTNAILKKWGGKVEDVNVMGLGADPQRVPISPDEALRAVQAGELHIGQIDVFPIEGKHLEKLAAFDNDPERFFDYVKENGLSINRQVPQATPIHGFVVTPEMKASVQQGQSLFQTSGGAKLGVTNIAENGDAIIRMAEASNVSTFLHEAVHIRLNDASAEHVAVFTDWLKTEYGMDLPEGWHKGSTTYKEAKEKVARAFENYSITGQAPTPAIKRVFEQIKQWMIDVYKQITGSDIDVKMTDAVRGVFDEWLGKTKVTRDPEDLAQTVKKMIGLEINPEGTMKKMDRRVNTTLRAVVDKIKKGETLTNDEAKVMLEGLTLQQTRLPNKTYYYAVIKGSDKELPYKVAIDMDFLKWFNDNGGHPVGDVVLKAFAEELQKVAGEGNAFHFSGDEFLAQFADEAKANAAMEKARKAFAKRTFEFKEMKDGVETGQTITAKGITFGWGGGADEKLADDILTQRKQVARKTRGLEPAGITRSPETGRVGFERTPGERDQWVELSAEEKARVDALRQKPVDIHYTREQISEIEKRLGMKVTPDGRIAGDLTPLTEEQIQQLDEVVQVVNKRVQTRHAWSQPVPKNARDPKAAQMIQGEAQEMLMDLWKAEEAGLSLDNLPWKVDLPAENPRQALVRALQQVISGEEGDDLTKALRKQVVANLENGAGDRLAHPYAQQGLGYLDDEINALKTKWQDALGRDPVSELDSLANSQKNKGELWQALINSPWAGDKSIADTWGQFANTPEMFAAHLRDMISKLPEGTADETVEALNALLFQVHNYHAITNNMAERLGMLRSQRNSIKSVIPWLPNIHGLPEGHQQFFGQAGEAAAQVSAMKQALATWRDHAAKQAASGAPTSVAPDVAEGLAGVSDEASEMLEMLRNLAAYGQEPDLDKQIVEAIGGEVNKAGTKKRVFEGTKSKWVDLTQNEKNIIKRLTANQEKYSNFIKLIGNVPEGALPKTNRFMIDYSDYGRLDEMIKQVVPFWTFTSRSFPFWLESMMEHPQILSFYGKYVALTRRVQYQEGIYTSTGAPMPSLEGYIKMPGTDIWFNPTAPYSFRYLITPFTKTYEEEYEGAPALQQVFMWMNDYASVFGVSVSPLFSVPASFFGWYGDAPTSAIVPQVNLLPPWWKESVRATANKIGGVRAGWAVNALLGSEVPWKDYLVERRILANTYERMQAAKNDAERMAIAMEAKQALETSNREQSDLWNRTMREMDTSETGRNWVGYFTGIYSKEFTDAEAEFQRLRDENNFYRDMINNQIGATIFGLDPSAENRYNQYKDRQYETPDGYLSNLYNVIRYTQSPEGEQLYGKERRDYVSQQIYENEITSAYYDTLSVLHTQLQGKLGALPIGADPEIKQQVWDWYFAERAKIEEDETYALARRGWAEGYKPADMLYEHFQGLWWQFISETKPQYDSTKMSYDEYQEIEAEWMAQLPLVSDKLRASFLPILAKNLKVEPEQLERDILKNGKDIAGGRTLDVSLILDKLMAETTGVGYQNWKMGKDGVYDALDEAWKALYYDKYWDALRGKSGYERDLVEQQWLSQNKPPTEQELISWILSNGVYEKNFDAEQLIEAYEGRKTESVESRTAPKTEMQEMEQKVWDILAMAGPNKKALQAAYEKLGGYWSDISTFYNVGGKAGAWQDPEDFKAMYDKLVQAANSLGLQEPDQATLKEYIEAKALNDNWEPFVTSQLGNDIMEVMEDYWAASSKVRSQMRKADKRIDLYYKMREQYADMYPVWAKYYTESSSTSTSSGKSSSGGGGGGYSGGGGGGGGYSGGGRSSSGGSSYTTDLRLGMGKRSTLEGRELPGKLGRGGYAGMVRIPPYIATPEPDIENSEK